MLGDSTTSVEKKFFFGEKLVYKGKNPTELEWKRPISNLEVANKGVYKGV